MSFSTSPWSYASRARRAARGLERQAEDGYTCPPETSRIKLDTSDRPSSGLIAELDLSPDPEDLIDELEGFR